MRSGHRGPSPARLLLPISDEPHSRLELLLRLLCVRELLPHRGEGGAHRQALVEAEGEQVHGGSDGFIVERVGAGAAVAQAEVGIWRQHSTGRIRSEASRPQTTLPLRETRVLSQGLDRFTQIALCTRSG